MRKAQVAEELPNLIRQRMLRQPLPKISLRQRWCSKTVKG
jgi:hypothetical protein